MNSVQLASLPLLASLLVNACTSFATIRSAEVAPGPSLVVQASATTPPGDEAAWFWTLDCVDRCNHAIWAADLGLAIGLASPTSPNAFALAVGLNGTYPYADGYIQLSRRPRAAYGLGARIGIPIERWNEYGVYGRLDRPLRGRQRLLLNPGVFYHTDHSGYYLSTPSFLALVQGVGLLLDGNSVRFAPGLSVIVARGRQPNYPEPFYTAFAMASATLSFQRHRAVP